LTQILNDITCPSGVVWDPLGPWRPLSTAHRQNTRGHCCPTHGPHTTDGAAGQPKAIAFGAQLPCSDRAPRPRVGELEFHAPRRRLSPGRHFTRGGAPVLAAVTEPDALPSLWPASCQCPWAQRCRPRWPSPLGDKWGGRRGFGNTPDLTDLTAIEAASVATLQHVPSAARQPHLEPTSHQGLIQRPARQ
jgi:hypothetical protein